MMRPALVFSFFVSFFVSFLVKGQESFIPAPPVFTSQLLETELESSYQFQLSTIKDLKGKEAIYVKESYKNRRDFLLGLLSEGEFIFESPIYDYVKGIFDQVLAANPEIDPKTVMLLSRSGIPNAFTTGDGFFVINLGLLVRLYNADQLAFVICHELGHQVLNHTNNRIRVAANEITDPNRKKEIQRVLKSEYKVATQLENLLLPGMMKRMQHSRNNEFDADSMAVKIMMNAGFLKEGAIEALGILDKSDEDIFTTKISWEVLFSDIDCQMQSYWEEVNTESSLGTFEKQKTKYEDELKTHPDCVLRIDSLKAMYSDMLPEVQTDTLNDYSAISQFSALELTESYLMLGNVGRSLHTALMIYFEHPEWAYPRETICYIFGAIAVYKKNRELGAHLDLSSPDYTESYNNLLEVIWAMSIKDCTCIATSLGNEMTFSNTESGQSAKMLCEYFKDPSIDGGMILRQIREQFPRGTRKYHLQALFNQSNTKTIK